MENLHTLLLILAILDFFIGYGMGRKDGAKSASRAIFKALRVSPDERIVSVSVEKINKNRK